jgi:hypothetical protein
MAIEAALLFLKPIGAFLKAIPWPVYAGIALVVAFVVFGGYKEHKGKKEGKDEVGREWAKEQAKVNKQIAELTAKANEITKKVEIKYVEVVKEIKVKGEEREKIVYKFIPADAPDLPPAFRVFHDAAVLNQIPNPSAIATAAPAPLKDVTITINDNYSLCHEAYARVRAWETWADEQEALTK